MGIIIDASIFPLVMSMSIGKPGSKEFQSIDLPRGANVLYLQSISDSAEIRLLKKFANKEEFTDEEYEILFNLFLNNTPRLSPPTENVGDFLHQFGICVGEKDNKFQFKLIEEYIPQIKVET